jgi:acetyl-CoA acyltransferase 2
LPVILIAIRRCFCLADLCTVSSKAAIQQAKVDPKLIDNIYVGNVSQTAADTLYLARHVGLRCGIPIETPALTINRLCGSGFETLVQASKSILMGESEICLAGGAESMSMAPYAVRYRHSRAIFAREPV